jgi:hypothetical protein
MGTRHEAVMIIGVGESEVGRRNNFLQQFADLLNRAEASNVVPEFQENERTTWVKQQIDVLSVDTTNYRALLTVQHYETVLPSRAEMEALRQARELEDETAIPGLNAS